MDRRPRLKAALIVVDLQNDFCRNGALPVPDADSVVSVSNLLLRRFPISVLTQDWHPRGHNSFASSFGALPFTTIGSGAESRVLWPDHCVAGSHGADFHPLLDTDRASLILRKGRNPELDSYSAFLENDRKTPTGLSGWISALSIDTIALVGLATDYCVKATALDARSLGLSVLVVSDGIRGVNAVPGDSDRALDEMRRAGCQILGSEEISA